LASWKQIFLSVLPVLTWNLIAISFKKQRISGVIFFRDIKPLSEQKLYESLYFTYRNNLNSIFLYVNIPVVF
jgi:hypothetical protein